MSTPLLRLRELSRRFGGVQAVDRVSIDVEEGSVHGLIGPNGAGKTTLVNLVSGQLASDSGGMVLGGLDVTRCRPHQIAAGGVARTFQSVRLLGGLSLSDNVVAGMHLRRRSDLAGRLLPVPRSRRERRGRDDEVARLLALVGLDPARRHEPAATLAYGDQRRLEMARALALRPRLLILDEPAAGLNRSERDGLGRLLARLNAEGLTMLLIDHDMGLVMSACHRVTVLNFGRKIAEDNPAGISSDSAVVKAYLGVEKVQPAIDPRPPPSARGSVGGGPAQPLLEVEGLEVRYGSVSAVRGVSLNVTEGEVVALLGSNGAGKSSVLNALSAVVRARSGRVVFAGHDVNAASAANVVRRGLVQVPEGREILAGMTVRENLELAGWTRRDSGRVAADIAGYEERFPILGQRRNLPAGQLSGGEQQILAIVRGLLARPRLLLLDEPSLGLAPQLAEDVFALIEQINRDGLAILLVEQNAHRALALASRAYVMETGRICLSGTAEALRNDPAVRQAYMGSS